MTAQARRGKIHITWKFSSNGQSVIIAIDPVVECEAVKPTIVELYSKPMRDLFDLADVPLSERGFGV
jgi:hypothetical protein